MSFRAEIYGTTVEADTAEELMALVNGTGSSQPEPEAPPSREDLKRCLEEIRGTHAAKVLSFIHAKGFGQVVNGDELIEFLGGGRQLGPAICNIAKQLRIAGLKREYVLLRKQQKVNRKPLKFKYWYKLTGDAYDAISDIEKFDQAPTFEEIYETGKQTFSE